MKKKDEIAKKRQELLVTRADMSAVNKALDLLRRINMVYDDGEKKRTFSRKPELSDFYTPSSKMKKYQFITMGIMGIVSKLVLAMII